MMVTRLLAFDILTDFLKRKTLISEIFQRPIMRVFFFFPIRSGYAEKTQHFIYRG